MCENIDLRESRMESRMEDEAVEDTDFSHTDGVGVRNPAARTEVLFGVVPSAPKPFHHTAACGSVHGE
jgi:hypothetical protein